jgi:hypothetical protein
LRPNTIPFHRLDRNMDMPDLLAEMQQCKTVKACIALALTDAYGEYEEASAWLACIETMFERFDRVKLMGEEVTLHGFDLANELAVVAICGKGKRRARVALESIEFPNLTPIEARWLKAWMQFSRGLP